MPGTGDVLRIQPLEPRRHDRRRHGGDEPAAIRQSRQHHLRGGRRARAVRAGRHDKADEFDGAMPDVEEAADAVLKGERKAKLKNTMYFHTAGLRFPYKNMHYTMVAGGNAFYEKRGRNWQPLPDEPDGRLGDAEWPAAAGDMVASAEPARRPDRLAPLRPSRPYDRRSGTGTSAKIDRPAEQTYVTRLAAPAAKSARVRQADDGRRCRSRWKNRMPPVSAATVNTRDITSVQGCAAGGGDGLPVDA